MYWKVVAVPSFFGNFVVAVKLLFSHVPQVRSFVKVQDEDTVTLKLEPAFGDLLRRSNPKITPGYYMNKIHWNSILLDGEVPTEDIKDYLKISYDIVLNSLSKKLQKELLEKI